MKLLIKNIKGEIFDIEADLDLTIAAVKVIISKLKNIDADCQKLIFKGVVTTNEKQLQEYKVTEKDFMVLMTTKKAQQNLQKQPSTQLESLPQPLQAQPNLNFHNQHSTQVESIRQPEPLQHEDPRIEINAASNGLVFGEAFDVAVDNLSSMGFRKPDVIRALHAAYNNPDRALDYLFNGIPDIFYMEQQLSRGENNSEPAVVNDNTTTSIPIVSRANNDNTAIERLSALGFRREVVSVVYFNCGKDENLAAHVLITNGEPAIENANLENLEEADDNENESE